MQCIPRIQAMRLHDRVWSGRCCYTHRPYKFCLNLVWGLSSYVLTVLVWTGAVHTPSLQVLFELGFGTEQLCADGPGLDRCCFTHTAPASSV